MKCLILAAGYATRLYPLTENYPKPLLTVKDKMILDWLLEDINDAGIVDQYIVITNHRFSKHFQAWASKNSLPIMVLDDGTETNETRLGAVRDIQFAIDAQKMNEDLFVIAGDNLLDFSLQGFIHYARGKNTSCIMRYWEPDVNKLHKTGVAEVDNSDRVTGMEEKPAEPKSNWCIPPFYIIKAADVPLVKKSIESQCGVDAPGSFIAWLCTKTAVHAYKMPGKRFDIGNLESYLLVQKEYNGIKKNGGEDFCG